MEFVIKDFVEKLTEEDINTFAIKEGLKLTDSESKTIYMYVKNYWRVFLKEDPTFLFVELKEKVEPNTFSKIVELYNKYKKK